MDAGDATRVRTASSGLSVNGVLGTERVVKYTWGARQGHKDLLRSLRVGFNSPLF